MPRAKRPGAAWARAPTLWAIRAGPRVKAGTMAVPEPQLGRPGRGQGERGEGVGAVGLARPGVGVAEPAQLREPVPLGVQRRPVEGDGDPVAVTPRRLAHQSPLRGGPPVGPDHGGLAGGAHEGAVLGPQVDVAVAEPPCHGLDADVDEHPLGRHHRGHPQGVVQAVRVDLGGEGLAEAHGHEVARARPAPRPRPRAARASGSRTRCARCRGPRARCGTRGGWRWCCPGRRRARGAGSPPGAATSGRATHWPSSGSSRLPSEAFTVKISVSPT